MASTLRVTSGEVVTIVHTRIVDGLDLSTELVLSRANVPWLVAYLGIAFAWVENPEPQRVAAGDALEAFPGGHDSHPLANIHNQRDGRFSHLTVDEAAARELVAQLEAVVSAAP